MKKLIVLLSLFFAVSLVMQAQNIKYGIRGGFGLSKPWNHKDTDMKSSYKVGFTSDITLLDNLSLQPALYFTNKGYKMSETGMEFIQNANYLELPISVALKIPLGGSLKLAINIGPYFACGVGGKSKLTLLGVEDDWKTFKGDGAIADAVSRFDWGATAGVALEIYFIDISVNYDLGLKNLSSMTQEEKKDNMKNGMLWFAVGIRY
jgi:hypothetical protein